MTLNTKAEANPSTEKLSTIHEQSSIMMALITSRNKPNVIIVTGRASNLMMGLMKVLSSASTTATTIKVIMPEPEDTSGIETPGVSQAERAMAMHERMSFAIMPIVVSSNVYKVR